MSAVWRSCAELYAEAQRALGLWLLDCEMLAALRGRQSCALTLDDRTDLASYGAYRRKMMAYSARVLIPGEPDPVMVRMAAERERV